MFSNNRALKITAVEILQVNEYASFLCMLTIHFMEFAVLNNEILAMAILCATFKYLLEKFAMKNVSTFRNLKKMFKGFKMFNLYHTPQYPQIKNLSH